ncbi:MAG: polymer-forming cytoskeletal protein [Desulfobacterales bacterium]|jgi:cytoskeletal protein CcmA (bactofilin family)
MRKDNSADSTSLLSKNVKIDGEIQGPENLHIEGYIKGSIKLSGDIFVGNTGIVKADLEAKNIVIQGEVTGNVLAHKQLEIHPSGKLIGDCTAATIDIKEGAVFEGRSNMIKSAGLSTGSRTSANISAAQSPKQHQS